MTSAQIQRSIEGRFDTKLPLVATIGLGSRCTQFYEAGLNRMVVGPDGPFVRWNQARVSYINAPVHLRNLTKQ